MQTEMLNVQCLLASQFGIQKIMTVKMKEVRALRVHDSNFMIQ